MTIRKGDTPELTPDGTPAGLRESAEIRAATPAKATTASARHKARLATALHGAGNVTTAHALLSEAITVLESDEDHGGLAVALEGRGTMERREGRPAEALVVFERARESARVANDRWHEARLIALAGHCLVQLGRHPEAIAAFEESLVLFVQHGDVFAQAQAHASLGLACHTSGDLRAATKHYAKAAEHYWALDMNAKAGDCENQIAKLRAKSGPHRKPG